MKKHVARTKSIFEPIDLHGKKVRVKAEKRVRVKAEITFRVKAESRVRVMELGLGLWN